MTKRFNENNLEGTKKEEEEGIQSLIITERNGMNNSPCQKNLYLKENDWNLLLYKKTLPQIYFTKKKPGVKANSNSISIQIRNTLNKNLANFTTQPSNSNIFIIR